MRHALLSLVLVVVACGDGKRPAIDAPQSPDPDGAVVDASGVCPAGGREKLKFEEATACANDGSVEFCIPDDDTELRAALTAISPAITCEVGGGRARCLDTPGLLLCFYPTRFPEQCEAQHGAMTAEVWADMCQLAARPEIREIVLTIFE